MTTTMTGDAQGNAHLGISPRFAVEVDGTIQATFSECSGLTATVKVDTWEEGGANHTTRKFPVRADFANLSLKHGVTESLDLYDWFLEALRGKRCRKSMTIKLLTQDLKELRSWQFANAFPVKWSGPSLQVGSTSVAVETVEFAHEGLIGEM